MSHAAATQMAVTVACGGASGFALGLVYLALLRRAVADYVLARPLWSPLLLTAVRLAAAAVVFWLLVQWSAVAAIAAALGFALARFTPRFPAGPS
jgi:hypothetical protein